MSSKKKPSNPEERLQANVGLEIHRRLLGEHAKAQADAVAVAKWESSIGQRDAMATAKRNERTMRDDAQLTSQYIHATREKNLKELYAEDEIIYSRELAARGLSFRKEYA